MRKEPVVIGAILGLSVLASRYLPGLLNLSISVVEETILMVLFPIFMAFLWWVW